MNFIRQISFILTTLVSLAPMMSQGYTSERVVLVIIDGLRYSEGLGDPDHTLVPRMADLAEQGTLIDNFRNDGATYTSRAIPAIWCGAWTDINSFSDPDCNGSNNNTTELPTVFEYYRKQLDRPAEDCVYTLKALCPWKASHDENYGPDYWPLYHSVGSDDLDVWHETEAVISQQSPRFLLMYLADVDHAGHGGDWDDYLSKISRADSLVGQLWDAIQADTAYAGKTTMLVTNDHGRHDYDFSGHGDGCEGCRHIQLLAIGPDIKINHLSDITRTIPDITPTIGELMGFTAELATGEVMHEILDQSLSTSKEQPQSHELLSVYPNPANQGAVIQFSIKTSSRLKLDMFDLSGRKVRSFSQETFPAGTGQVTWDGQNNQGAPLPSGTYLIRMETSTGVQVAKIIFLK